MILRRLTPAGVGGVALVELRGAGAARALAPLCVRGLPAPGRVRLTRLRTPEGEPVDEVLVARAAPDAFELGCHGGPAVVAAVVGLLRRVGAQEAGEPSLAQAGPDARVALEAEAALPRATTELGVQVLLRQAEAWAGALQALRAADALAPALERLLASARLGRALIAPPRVVLCGAPNAGKSSLLNALLGRARVLVAAEPGTTRDAIEEPVELDGLPVRLVDTAGLRDAPGAIEGEGIARAERLAAAADLRLVVVDLTAPVALEVAAPRLVVGNKADLHPAALAAPVALEVSARTGAGLDALRVRLRQALVGDADPSGAVVFTPRQEGLVRGALRAAERGDRGRALHCLSAVDGA